MPAALHRRLPFLALAITCAGLLGFGYFLEFVQGLEPCPLCIFQRVAFMAVLAIALVAALHGPRYRGNVVYSLGIVIAAIAGAALAARQTWLQHLPAESVPECGPGLEFMLQIYPLGETIARTLRGTGDCAEVDWTFLGLSIAEWSLLCFLGIVAFTLLQVWTRARATHRQRRHRSSPLAT